jgi:hypothetical protein
MRIIQVDPDDEPLSKIILSQIQAERIFHFIVTRGHGKNEQQEHGVYRRVEEWDGSAGRTPWLHTWKIQTKPKQWRRHWTWGGKLIPYHAQLGRDGGNQTGANCARPKAVETICARRAGTVLRLDQKGRNEKRIQRAGGKISATAWAGKWNEVGIRLKKENPCADARKTRDHARVSWPLGPAGPGNRRWRMNWVKTESCTDFGRQIERGLGEDCWRQRKRKTNNRNNKSTLLPHHTRETLKHKTSCPDPKRELRKEPNRTT